MSVGEDRMVGLGPPSDTSFPDTVEELSIFPFSSSSLVSLGRSDLVSAAANPEQRHNIITVTCASLINLFTP